MRAEVNKETVLRFLCRGRQQTADETLRRAVDEATALLDDITPAFVYRVFSIRSVPNGVAFDGCSLVLTDSHIVRHLNGCHKAAVLAVTLGINGDRLLRRLKTDRLSDAVIVDACLNDAVEQAADAASEELRRLAAREKASITKRFSPGYGNFALSHQTILLSILDAQRKIGLYVTDDHLLIPQKSITALIGFRAENEGSSIIC